MVREFKLPDIGEGLTEAEIVTWLVEPGDRVSEDQPVAEVETDKAVVEVPAPVDGTVREILAEEGELVPVGTVIITFDVEGEGKGPSDSKGDRERSDSQGSASRAEAEREPEPTDRPDESRSETTGDGRVFAAPSARRLARELDVDIAVIEGSGPGGRVTETDVRAVAEGDGQTEQATGGSVRSATRRVRDEGDERSVIEAAAAPERDRTLAAPATRRIAHERGVDIDVIPTDETREGEPFVTESQVVAYAESQREAQAADAATVAEPETSADGAVDERIPYRGIRRTIGERMERSKFTAPHVTHHDEVDVTRLVEIRGRLKERAEERGASLSYMPLVIKAAVAGLREHPILNSRLDEDEGEIVVRGEYNVGIATATDAGLMVPVIENADEKGLLELAEELTELVDKARNRSIAREEMQGGTFTVTNFGAIGGEYATPIINHPETAILGVGAITKKPRVADDGGFPSVEPDGSVSGEVVPRYVLTLSLSIDHRVIDGADAARFVNTVKEYLRDPELLLLE